MALHGSGGDAESARIGPPVNRKPLLWNVGRHHYWRVGVWPESSRCTVVPRGHGLDLIGQWPYRPAMDRRRFLATSLAGPLVVPLAASAQPSKSVARVGFLGSSSAERDKTRIEAFRHFDKLPALAAELVRLNRDVLVVAGAPAAHDAKKATRTSRIVMTNAADSVGTGLVASPRAAGWQCHGAIGLQRRDGGEATGDPQRDRPGGSPRGGPRRPHDIERVFVAMRTAPRMRR
jgi:hypothetical protein